MVLSARRVLIALALSLRSLAQFDSQAAAPLAPLSCRKGYVQHYPIVLGCEGGDRQITFELAKAGEPKHVFFWQAPSGTEDLRVMAKFPSARAAAENASLRVACAHDGKVLIDSESSLLNASSFHAHVDGTEWWLGRSDELDGDVSEIWFHAKGALRCDAAVSLSNEKHSQLKGMMQYQWTRVSQCPKTLLGCRPCSEAKESCGAGQVAVCDGSPSVSCHKDVNEAAATSIASTTTPTTTTSQAATSIATTTIPSATTTLQAATSIASTTTPSATTTLQAATTSIDSTTTPSTTTILQAATTSIDSTTTHNTTTILQATTTTITSITTTIAQASRVSTTLLAIVSKKSYNGVNRSVSSGHSPSAKLAGEEHKLDSSSNANSPSLLHVLSAKLATAAGKHESSWTSGTLPKTPETVGKTVSDSVSNTSSKKLDSESNASLTSRSILHVLSAKLATATRKHASRETSDTEPKLPKTVGKLVSNSTSNTSSKKPDSESNATSATSLHVPSAKLATAASKHESHETSDTVPKLSETASERESDSTSRSKKLESENALSAKLATGANKNGSHENSDTEPKLNETAGKVVSNSTLNATSKVVAKPNKSQPASTENSATSTLTASGRTTSTESSPEATSTSTAFATTTSTVSAAEAKNAFLASKVRMNGDSDLSTTLPNTDSSNAVAEIDVDHDGHKDVFFLGNDKNRDGNIKWVGPYPLAHSSRRSSTSRESHFAPKLASTSHEGYPTTTSSSKAVQPTLIPDAWIKQIRASKPSWASTAGALGIGLAAVFGLVAISCCCVCIHVRRGSRSRGVEQRASELPPRAVVRDVNAPELANAGVGAGRLGYPAGYEPVRCEDQSFQSDYRATSMASSEAAGLRLLGHDGM